MSFLKFCSVFDYILFKRRKLIAHRQSVQDDKMVGTNTSENGQKTGDEQTDQNNMTESHEKEPDESLYMELPDQPKRRAPSPPRKLPSRDSQSFKNRRKAPPPPSTPRPTGMASVLTGKVVFLTKSCIVSYICDIVFYGQQSSSYHKDTAELTCLCIA